MALGHFERSCHNCRCRRRRRGGEATTLQAGKESYRAAGGNGGNGGDGGGLKDGHPVNGINGKGCYYGLGGDGEEGAVAPPAEGSLVSDGGNDGKGFPKDSWPSFRCM